MSKKNKGNVQDRPEMLEPVQETQEGQTETLGQETTQTAPQDATGTKPEPVAAKKEKKEKPPAPPKKTESELLAETIAAFDLDAFCATYGIDRGELTSLVDAEKNRTFGGKPLNAASLPVRIYDILNAQDEIYGRHAFALMRGKKEETATKEFFLAVLHLAPESLGTHVVRTADLRKDALYNYPIGN